MSRSFYLVQSIIQKKRIWSQSIFHIRVWQQNPVRLADNTFRMAPWGDLVRDTEKQQIKHLKFSFQSLQWENLGKIRIMLTMFSRKGQLGRTAHSYFSIVWGRRNPFWMGVIPSWGDSNQDTYLEPHNTLQLQPKLPFELYLKFTYFYTLTLHLWPRKTVSLWHSPGNQFFLGSTHYSDHHWWWSATKELGLILYAVAAYPSYVSSARSITFQNLFQN